MEASNYNFHEGLNAIEDLSKLGDTSLSPILNRFYFHFTQINKQSNTMETNGLDFLGNFLKKSIIEIISEFMLKKEGVSQFHIFENTNSIDAKSWDKLLAVLPLMLQVVAYFKYSGSLEIAINSEGLKIVGDIDADQSIEQYRKEIYALYRKLFKNQVLLTFSLDESITPGCYNFTLSLDSTHSDELAYCIDNTHKTGILLGIPNAFSRYQIADSVKEELGKHTCLEITDELTLQRHNCLPDKIKDDLTKEILYFRFIFRPISIIIPNRGKIFPMSNIDHYSKLVNGLQNAGDTGSGKAVKQNVEPINSPGFHYIDLFSLLGQ